MMAGDWILGGGFVALFAIMGLVMLLLALMVIQDWF